MNLLNKLRLLSKPRLGVLVIGIVCVASVLVFVLNPATRKGPLGFGPPAAMVMFTASDNSYSILYPGNWIARETPQGSQGDPDIIAVIVVSGQQHAIVNIARKSFPNGNIDQAISWGLSRASERIGYSHLQLEATAWNNNYYVQEYTWGDSPLIRCQDLYAYEQLYEYTLTFCSDDSHWLSLKDYFLTMMQSVSFQQ